MTARTRRDAGGGTPGKSALREGASDFVAVLGFDGGEHRIRATRVYGLRRVEPAGLLIPGVRDHESKPVADLLRSERDDEHGRRPYADATSNTPCSRARGRCSSPRGPVEFD
jgi:hypothetical protein